MNKFIAIALCVLVRFGHVYAQNIAQPSTPETGIPECSSDQLVGKALWSSPAVEKEIANHRDFTLPIINYPYGTKLNSGWGIQLTLRIDATGKVVCYRGTDKGRKELTMTDERRAMIESIRHWHYKPFIRDGQPAGSTAEEFINEQESPAAHVAFPSVLPKNIHFMLNRSGCFGSCPSYQVDIYGDGRVVFNGSQYVDVLGKHTFQISAGEVTKLVESARVKDLWSLRDQYVGCDPDSPGYEIDMIFGSEHHKITDCMGAEVGMPVAVTEFEDELDNISRVSQWIHLSSDAVVNMKAEHYRFNSRKGAELLARAVADHDSHDEMAMLELLRLGVPIYQVHLKHNYYDEDDVPLLELALRHHRTMLIDALIKKGALVTNGVIDKQKLNHAFWAAISGGRLRAVKTIWNAGGKGGRPLLSFDEIDDKLHVHRQLPVIFLLNRLEEDDKNWEGFQVAKWLETLGCDIKAVSPSGITLLHRAANSDDVDFVQYALDQGIPVSTLDKDGTLALGYTHNEDIALLLLDAGTDLTLIETDGYSFRNFAQGNGWNRVLKWLDAHHQ